MGYERFKPVDKPYRFYLEQGTPWKKPKDRGRTPSENRAAIAKVDQLVDEAGLTKTQACCKVELHLNTYYVIKRKDGRPPTPPEMVKKVKAANNAGGPGRPRKDSKKNKLVTIDTTEGVPLSALQQSLEIINHEVTQLQALGINLQIMFG